MKKLISSERSLPFLLIIFFIMIVLSSTGNKNKVIDNKQNGIGLDSLTQKKAIDFAINAIINSKVTSLPRECLTVLNIERNVDIITFELRELHDGGSCPGDINSSPLVTIVQVNTKTKEVGIQTDYRDPFDILDQNGGKTDYFGDRHYLYYKGKIVDGADPKSFVYFKRQKDKDTKISDDFLFDGFGRDKNHVYINGVVVKGADAATFKVANDGKYAMDKKNNYSYVQVSNTFEIDDNPCLIISNCK